ncbi:hypothetical protein, partial [Marinicella litoralis]
GLCIDDNTGQVTDSLQVNRQRKRQVLGLSVTIFQQGMKMMTQPKNIKALIQTAHYLQRPDIELLDKLQQLKDEIVRVSHQPEPDLKLHRFLMNHLKRTQQQLSEFRKSNSFDG